MQQVAASVAERGQLKAPCVGGGSVQDSGRIRARVAAAEDEEVAELARRRRRRAVRRSLAPCTFARRRLQF